MDSLTPAHVARNLPLSADVGVELEHEIGHGAFTTVYAGCMSGPFRGPRHVAVKVFDHLPHVGRNHVIEGLTVAMARAKEVHDRRVVTVYHCDLARLQPFIVEEQVDGGTLETAVAGLARQGTQLPPDAVVLIGLSIAEGLAAALTCRLPNGTPAPLVHGHLTMRDVLISWTGEVKVRDFGVHSATMLAPGAGFTDASHLAPMSPELVRGEAPDERSDVFALGVLLREMFLGPRFHAGTTLDEAKRMARSGTMPGRAAESAIFAPLRSLVRRATHPDPRRRYAHAGELAAELRAVASALGILDAQAIVARTLEDAFTPDPREYVRERADTDAFVTTVDSTELVEEDPQDLAVTSVSWRTLENAPTVVCTTLWFQES